jgi:hypothetical protein
MPEVVEIKDNEEGTSLLTAKISSKVQSEALVGSRVASSSNPVSSPTANSTPPGAEAGDRIILPVPEKAGKAKVEPIGK